VTTTPPTCGTCLLLSCAKRLHSPAAATKTHFTSLGFFLA
jgi:hypothetical protein